MAPVTHLLFDFFGTLVEYSESRIEQGYRLSHELLLAHGAQLEYGAFLERWDGLFGDFEADALRSLDEYSMDAVCSEFLNGVLTGAGAETTALFRDTYLKEWNKGVRYMPGVPELLADLAKTRKLVLVTNTHHAELVQQHLRTMDVARHFDAVITSVEHGRRKPSACIFERALELCGGVAACSLYVGDSLLADYRGAESAGLPCWLIDPGRRHDVPDEHRLGHILDLRARLA
jgi:putative hydrolase of the HAD superfamily